MARKQDVRESEHKQKREKAKRKRGGDQERSRDRRRGHDQGRSRQHEQKDPLPPSNILARLGKKKEGPVFEGGFYLDRKADKRARATERASAEEEVDEAVPPEDIDIENMKGIGIGEYDADSASSGNSDSAIAKQQSTAETSKGDRARRTGSGAYLSASAEQETTTGVDANPATSAPTASGGTDDVYLAETDTRKGFLKQLQAPLRKFRRLAGGKRGLTSEFGDEFVKFDAEEEPQLDESRKGDEEVETEASVDLNSLPPWLRSTVCLHAQRHSRDLEVMLHYEILDFACFMSASDAEKRDRDALVNKITEIVKTIWPHAVVKLFGSFATNLYLPASDIDLCVLETPAGGVAAEMHELAEALRSTHGLVRKIEVITRARIPLIKLVDRVSGVQCDISFGLNNGPSNVLLIRKYLRDFPSLKPLLLVVKCFLQQRGLNEVYRGGLGSYALLLLIVSHLQHYRSNFRHRLEDEKGPPVNLGAALFDFFTLYGQKFNYVFTGIGIKANGRYNSKRNKYVTDALRPVLLSIEDPQDQDNEIAKNSFNLHSIRRAFGHAQQELLKWRPGMGAQSTPLGRILHSDKSFQSRAVMHGRTRAPQRFPTPALFEGLNGNDNDGDDDDDNEAEEGEVEEDQDQEEESPQNTRDTHSSEAADKGTKKSAADFDDDQKMRTRENN